MKHILISILAFFSVVAFAADPVDAFKLQTDSGQLWPVIVAYRAEAQAVADKASARVATLEAFLAKAKEAFNAGDFDAAKAILNPEIAKAEQSEKDKRKAELEEQKAKIQAELDALDAKAAGVVK